MASEGSINHYHYTLMPPARDGSEEKWALQQIWPELTKLLGAFVVQCPRHIFSPSSLETELTLSVPPELDKGRGERTVRVKRFQVYSAEQVNTGLMGEAEVVAQHIVKQLVEPMKYQRVGRRYFNNCDAMEGKAQLTIFSGFYAALNPMGSRCGNSPQMQIDTTYRALHKRNVIDSLGLDDPLDIHDPDVQSEWRRRCLGATVVTTYINRVYRIKAIHFDKGPRDTFQMYQRDQKVRSETTYIEYYRAYYQRDINEQRQPLLEAFPEKDSECVFLVPELCALTGFNDEMRKDKNLMAEAYKQTKVSPQERLGAIQGLAGDLAQFASAKELSGWGTQPGHTKCVQDWQVSLDKKPLEVDARIFEPLEVCFGQKTYTIEDGNFQRWMRNGLMCSTRFDDWLFIYPESDVPVLEIWLGSLRDIAQVAFQIKMADPQRIICTDQRRDIVRLLEQKLTPKTQMVLLLTPQKDCKRVYQLFKQATCSRFPCVTQVVKSETVRKRQSIAAVLCRIALQINAKFCGPLWQIELASPMTQPLFSVPTMIIGVDVFCSCEREQYVGFAASLDTHCTEYYSIASALDADKPRQSMSVKLQTYLRDALLHFARRNDSLLPEQILVYRASTRHEEWLAVHATEIEALRRVLAATEGSNSQGRPYEPRLTFIAISRRVGIRFFSPSPNEQNIKNPEPGTVVDSNLTSRSDTTNFFLINQAVGKGTATPTHYTVLFDNANLAPNVLQNLSYRLSFLYFNYTGSVKMPAPAQYAKKIAHLVGTAVRADPHKRLLCTLFYL